MAGRGQPTEAVRAIRRETEEIRIRLNQRLDIIEREAGKLLQEVRSIIQRMRAILEKNPRDKTDQKVYDRISEVEKAIEKRIKGRGITQGITIKCEEIRSLMQEIVNLQSWY